MPNSVVKSVKIPIELHREIKAESVQTDENIEAVIERAWRAYRSDAALPPVPATGETRVAGRAHPDAESKSPTPQEVAGCVEFLMNAGRDEDVRAILTIVRSLCHEPKGSPHQNEAAEVSDAEAIRAANRLAKAARGGNASARRALEKLGFTLAANGGDTGTEGANSKKKAS